jgi:hypothetical protein
MGSGRRDTGRDGPSGPPISRPVKARKIRPANAFCGLKLRYTEHILQKQTAKKHLYVGPVNIPFFLSSKPSSTSRHRCRRCACAALRPRRPLPAALRPRRPLPAARAALCSLLCLRRLPHRRTSCPARADALSALPAAPPASHAGRQWFFRANSSKFASSYFRFDRKSTGTSILSKSGRNLSYNL